MGLKQHGEREDLQYVDGLLAIDIDDTNRREREEAVRGFVNANPGWAIPGRQRLRQEFDDDDLVDRVAEFVDVIEVDDPLAAAESLNRETGVKASPIHALGFSWHRAMTSTRHQPAPRGTVFPDLPAGDRDRLIAVVDTGIVDPGSLPTWMSSSIIAGADDLESIGKGDASHGTFVASLIRQVAPTHVVSMARAAEIPGDDGERPQSHPRPDPTTEFHVAGAIHRLIERHIGRPRVEALNLSLGGPPAKQHLMVTLRKAIGKWREVFPESRVFAAAGNTTEEIDIYPAKFRDVRGVAAAKQGGGQIVWNDEDEALAAPERDWVDDVAPGAKLIGLKGSSEEAIAWSGSSFASAVAVASYVNGGPVQVRDDITYWPDYTMRYGDVPGLKYV